MGDYFGGPEEGKFNVQLWSPSSKDDSRQVTEAREDIEFVAANDHTQKVGIEFFDELEDDNFGNILIKNEIDLGITEEESSGSESNGKSCSLEKAKDESEEEDDPNAEESNTSPEMETVDVEEVLAKTKQDNRSQLFVCPRCGERLTGVKEVEKHVMGSCGPKDKNTTEANTKIKPFFCPCCEKRFASLYGIEMHLKQHTGERVFLCGECGKSFTHPNSLRSHTKFHTGVKPFSCTLCEKRFYTRTDLKAHMRVHTGEKPFSCPYCEKCFSAKFTLRGHLRLHTGEKPYTCPVCASKFSNKSNMLSHTKTHVTDGRDLGDKNYTCDVCGKSFRGRSYLNKHFKAVHTEDKLMPCPICDKKFRKWNLKRHLISHSDEKPFACSECSYRARDKELLASHTKVHNKNRELFPCNLCSTEFSTRRTLERHKMNKHLSSLRPSPVDSQVGSSQKMDNIVIIVS